MIKKKKIIVTGSAGFVGFYVCLKLLERGDEVFGIDNHNNYYDVRIKDSRLEILNKYSNYKHYKIDISDTNNLDKVF